MKVEQARYRDIVTHYDTVRRKHVVRQYHYLNGDIGIDTCFNTIRLRTQFHT